MALWIRRWSSEPKIAGSSLARIIIRSYSVAWRARRELVIVGDALPHIAVLFGSVMISGTEWQRRLVEDLSHEPCSRGPVA